MKSVTVSSPGKLMLMGEHAVVYGKPCLSTTIDQRLYATVEATDSNFLEIDAPEVKLEGYKKEIKELTKGKIPKGAEYIEYSIKNLYEKYNLSSGLKIQTKSDFSSEVGFGSSSASSVCAVYGASKIFDLDLSNKDVFDVAYKAVIDIKGVGSGYDIASTIYGGVIYYVTPGKVIRNIQIPELDIIVGYAGYKTVTADVVNMVKALEEKYKFAVSNAYDQMEKIVEEGTKALENSDLETFGELMNINQGYLDAILVNDRVLSDMIYAAREAGAYGAKISGSGLGDCMIALAPKDKKKAVIDAINSTKGKYIELKTNVEGVRVETKK
jgi:mevalonate kinase